MIRFIDLFAGIGGIRKGFEIAFQKCGYETECVMTSEIKPHAYKVLQANHPQEEIRGDITKIDAETIPDFDFCSQASLVRPFLLQVGAWVFKILEEHYSLK